MHNSAAIILAGLIVGASIVYTGYVDSYQISATQGANDIPVAWRINARTGIMAACYPKKQSDGKYKVFCD
jgi:archaellum component FlaF (FlaF/FlaG flagellin family)